MPQQETVKKTDPEKRADEGTIMISVFPKQQIIIKAADVILDRDPSGKVVGRRPVKGRPVRFGAELGGHLAKVYPSDLEWTDPMQGEQKLGLRHDPLYKVEFWELDGLKAAVRDKKHKDHAQALSFVVNLNEKRANHCPALPALDRLAVLEIGDVE